MLETRDFQFLTPPCLPIEPLGGLQIHVQFFFFQCSIYTTIVNYTSIVKSLWQSSKLSLKLGFFSHSYLKPILLKNPKKTYSKIFILIVFCFLLVYEYQELMFRVCSRRQGEKTKDDLCNFFVFQGQINAPLTLHASFCQELIFGLSMTFCGFLSAWPFRNFTFQSVQK